MIEFIHSSRYYSLITIYIILRSLAISANYYSILAALGASILGLQIDYVLCKSKIGKSFYTEKGS